MIRYSELIVCICMIISVADFIAIGSVLKKKRQIFKVLYLIHIVGIVVISNLVIWMEGWYVDENNLSGSTVSFFFNVCNIILFFVNAIMLVNYRKSRMKDRE